MCLQVRGLGKTFDSLGPSVFATLDELKKDSRLRQVAPDEADSQYSVYFDKVGRVDGTSVFLLDQLEEGDVVKGPAMIIDDTQTILLDPESEGTIAGNHLVIDLH